MGSAHNFFFFERAHTFPVGVLSLAPTARPQFFFFFEGSFFLAHSFLVGVFEKKLFFLHSYPSRQPYYIPHVDIKKAKSAHIFPKIIVGDSHILFFLPTIAPTVFFFEAPTFFFISVGAFFLAPTIPPTLFFFRAHNTHTPTPDFFILSNDFGF